MFRMLGYTLLLEQSDNLRTCQEILQAELDWSAGRPSSRALGRDLSVEDKNAFIQSLTPNEYEFFLKYRQMAPRGLYSLNQNPRVRGMKSRLNQARGLQLT